MQYFFPELRGNVPGQKNPFFLGGTQVRFDAFKILERGRSSLTIPAMEAPQDVLETFIRPRSSVFDLDFNKVNIMGILNVTPDSFYDGNDNFKGTDFLKKGFDLIKGGLDILDIGGESTRPGARELPIQIEKQRVSNVIKSIKKFTPKTIISVDTRKSEVAKAAIKAGASIINDVSGTTFDKEILSVASKFGAGICIMHSKGLPENMQSQPFYENVLLDVYDFLKEKFNQAKEAGISEEKIIVDPGIGFGKNLSHNKTLIKNISLFHGLGCPVMVGLSRKSIIGEIVGELNPSNRLGGSLAAVLAVVSRGAHIVRVHDVNETKQAIEVWNSLV